MSRLRQGGDGAQAVAAAAQPAAGGSAAACRCSATSTQRVGFRWLNRGRETLETLVQPWDQPSVEARSVACSTCQWRALWMDGYKAGDVSQPFHVRATSYVCTMFACCMRGAARGNVPRAACTVYLCGTCKAAATATQRESCCPGNLGRPDASSCLAPPHGDFMCRRTRRPPATHSPSHSPSPPLTHVMATSTPTG